MSEKPKRKPKIRGFKRDLDGGRSVFVGKLKGAWFIRMENPALPEPTMLQLSDEAMTALVELRDQNLGGTVNSTLHLLMRWMDRDPWWERLPPSRWFAR